MLLAWSFLLPVVAGAAVTDCSIRLETRRDLDSHLANVHLEYSREVKEAHSFTYGPCESDHPSEAHHEVARHQSGVKADRLVWIIPQDTIDGGCLSAWSENKVRLGRSEPLSFHRKQKPSLYERSKVSIPMTPENGIDIKGAWFDGVALLEGKNPSVDVAAAKAKEIAIVGAGMSGLMTYLNLRNAGLTNVKIIEASDRIGGRIKTAYLEGGPSEYQYHEMGAMRFPQNVTFQASNETLPINDQRLVFEIAAEINEINKGKEELQVKFIPWIQNDPNGLYYFNGIRKPDGTVPTLTEIATDPSLTLPAEENPAADVIEAQIANLTNNHDLLRQMALNMPKAYKEFMASGLNGLGGDDWSEFAYFHNRLGFSLNETDRGLDGFSEGTLRSFYFRIFERFIFGGPGWQTHWKTIDGGLSRLAGAFQPFIKKDLTLGREIERVEHLPEGDGKVKLLWKKKYTDTTFQEATYDYAVISAPFPVVRRWRLPRFSTTLRHAVHNLAYGSACKVILQFSTRFWEHLPKPIYGGMSVTDIPGINTVVYPSYKINSTGPGVLIASYAVYDLSTTLAAMPEEEYVQYVLDAMAEMHGDVVREQYTGRYSRQCWNTARYTSGGWAEPTIGQQSLYMQSYFKTDKNVIFIGEHTSYTHAWVASALESGVRGSVQLLLELGLVDEAKEVAYKWRGRWMNL